MNAVGSEEAVYIAFVLTLYADLPDTPSRSSPMDQSLARKLHQEAVPLALVESACLLATLRRLARAPNLPPLPKIRSPAYFLPVIADLQQQPLPAGYLTMGSTSGGVVAFIYFGQPKGQNRKQ